MTLSVALHTSFTPLSKWKYAQHAGAPNPCEVDRDMTVVLLVFRAQARGSSTHANAHDCCGRRRAIGSYILNGAVL
jgi:hypothetical protein